MLGGAGRVLGGAGCVLLSRVADCEAVRTSRCLLPLSSQVAPPEWVGDAATSRVRWGGA